MGDFLRIGSYQLRNLLAQQVVFRYLDLRTETSRTHVLLQGARSVGPLTGDELLALLTRENSAKNDAIVLICENGSKSVPAAQVLADNSFINVFVIEGGVDAIESEP